MFIAVWPPSSVVAALAAMPRPVDPALRWTTEDQWHVTLRFLGSVEADAAMDAWHAISLVGLAPVEAVLGPAVGRFGDRILHLPVSGLEALAAVVVAATASLGEPAEDRAFRGHVTLARARRRRADLRPYVGYEIAGGWPVDELTLVVSHTHPKGATYEVVARRPL